MTVALLRLAFLVIHQIRSCVAVLKYRFYQNYPDLNIFIRPPLGWPCRLLIVVVLTLCAVIVLAGWLRGATDFWHMLEIGLSLAIAAVREGLPAVTTMTLALGMQRMARMRALVRRLPFGKRR